MQEDEQLLERAIRDELRELRSRIARGKGEWGKSNYVNDGTWGSWVRTENFLSLLLKRAGLDDGKE